MQFAKNSTVLFQGDSITHGGRGEDLNHYLGHGYAFLIAARLGADVPQLELNFLNRGISGNRLPDLYARWQRETLNLRPDVLSIHIGINDVAHQLFEATRNQAARYEDLYAMLLEDTLAELPAVRLVLCDPFVLPVGERVTARWAEWQAAVQCRQQIVARLAARFGAVHVPFQAHFDRALAEAPADYWIWDGVHPTPAGHEIMARAWLQAVEEA